MNVELADTRKEAETNYCQRGIGTLQMSTTTWSVLKLDKHKHVQMTDAGLCIYIIVSNCREHVSP